MSDESDFYKFAAEFKNRKRPKLAAMMGVNFLVTGVIFLIFLWMGLPNFNGLEWLGFLVMFVLVVVGGTYINWTRSAPNCPNCKSNIVLGRPVHCHLCGQMLKNGCCDRCDVNESWTAMFGNIGANSGNNQVIQYCPHCGVWLDTDFRRLQRRSG